MGAGRTSTLLTMLGKCGCAQRDAVLAAALASFFATYTFPASGTAADAEGSAEGSGTSRAAPTQDHHVSPRQQEAIKRIMTLQELGLLVFGRMLSVSSLCFRPQPFRISDACCEWPVCMRE